MKVREVSSKRGFFSLDLREILSYKDLLFLFVRRDFVSVYKQTILGPIWFFIQPIFTTLIFSVIFGRLAQISTDGLPTFLFYLTGISCWNYFSDCLLKTSNTFVQNSGLFGKVYFPRLITPLSIVMSNLLKLGVQLLMFFAVYIYFYFDGATIEMNRFAFLLPVLILMMAALGLGLGLMISSLTTKYRDLQFLIAFGIQLFMYATPVVYPLSLVQEKLGEYAWIAFLNPMSAIIETFKYGFLGKGVFDLNGFMLSAGVIIVILILGVFTFNKVEKSFMDTV